MGKNTVEYEERKERNVKKKRSTIEEKLKHEKEKRNKRKED
jgi:hypothetical protein